MAQPLGPLSYLNSPKNPVAVPASGRIYMIIIYTQNLGLMIAVFVLEIEHGRFRGNTERTPKGEPSWERMQGGDYNGSPY